MQKVSVGILMYRRRGDVIEVFLVHPGGPFWSKKDAGVWSIPKGLLEAGEEPIEAAKREFGEETGCKIAGDFTPLSPVKIRADKVVQAWAVEGDCDAASVRSNTFEIEWPPHSGRKREFPEVDRAAWFTFEEAREKINKGQMPLLEELENALRE